ncbi:hypothetical protein, partial [Streptomyces mirabilis]
PPCHPYRSPPPHNLNLGKPPERLITPCAACRPALSARTHTLRGRYGTGASTFAAPATKLKLVIPKRTREALEHHHAARAQA